MARPAPWKESGHGRAAARGHRVSPGVQQSPTAEIAPQQRLKLEALPLTRPSFNPYMFDWFMGMITLKYGVVKGGLQIFLLPRARVVLRGKKT